MGGRRVSAARFTAWVFAAAAVLVAGAPLAGATCPAVPRDCQVRVDAIGGGAQAVPSSGASAAYAGDSGDLIVSLWSLAGASNTPTDVTLTVSSPIVGIDWQTGTTRTVQFDPAAPQPHVESFSFRVSPAALPGTISIGYKVSIPGEWATASADLEVAAAGVSAGAGASTGGHTWSTPAMITAAAIGAAVGAGAMYAARRP